VLQHNIHQLQEIKPNMAVTTVSLCTIQKQLQWNIIE